MAPWAAPTRMQALVGFFLGGFAEGCFGLGVLGLAYAARPEAGGVGGGSRRSACWPPSWSGAWLLPTAAWSSLAPVVAIVARWAVGTAQEVRARGAAASGPDRSGPDRSGPDRHR